MLKKYIKILFLIFVFLLFACNLETEKQSFNPYQLSLKDTKNNIYKFEEDKKFIIIYWATWCSICTQTMPILNNFYNKNNIEIVGISLDEGSKTSEKIKNYAQKHKIEFPLLMLTKEEHFNEAVKKNKIKYLPTILFFNKNGQQIKKHIGYISEEELEKLHKKLYLKD